MNLNSPAWTERWSKDKYQRLYPNFYVYGYGSDSEPASSCWMATLLAPMGERFREGIRVLDYGCGGGRLFNFMTGQLRSFMYYGAEPAGGKELAVAESYFKSDPRAKFMTCEEAVESEEVLSCDAVILGSIFTHLLEEKCESILRSIWPIVDGGGMIIFTAIFRPEAEAHRPGAHGFDDCYAISFMREGWIEDLERKLSRKVEEVDTYLARVLHRVYRIQ